MRIFRRGVASAAVLGLTVTLTGTAAAARPGAAAPPGADACAYGRPTSAAELLKRAEDCSDAPGRRGAVPPTERAAEASALNALRAQPEACGPPYVRGDPRLGPRYLPRTGYFGYLMRGYERYGRLSPSRFLHQYWNEEQAPAPGWRYPPDEGFVHRLRDVNSRPARYKVVLRAGQYVDRFGAETGRYLAPGGASFTSRGLPPDSLNTRADDPKHLCNYHLYRVVKRFPVDAGPIQPAFRQPGKGLQFVIMRNYFTDPPATVNTKWLVDNGYLRRIY